MGARLSGGSPLWGYRLGRIVSKDDHEPKARAIPSIDSRASSRPAIPCLGLNGGPAFKHTEAFSFQVATDDQAETDRLWNAVVGNGGQESAYPMAGEQACMRRGPDHARQCDGPAKPQDDARRPGESIAGAAPIPPEDCQRMPIRDPAARQIASRSSPTRKAVRNWSMP
jgi:hypothetical protein